MRCFDAKFILDEALKQVSMGCRTQSPDKIEFFTVFMDKPCKMAQKVQTL